MVNVEPATSGRYLYVEEMDQIFMENAIYYAVKDGILLSNSKAVFLNNVTHKKIFISTTGDGSKEVLHNIQAAKKSKADILVTACHTGSGDKTQYEIVAVDMLANFILKHQYSSWSSLSRVDKDSIEDEYVNRLKNTLV